MENNFNLKTATEREMSALFDAANIAGVLAAKAVTPEPMHVVGHDPRTGMKIRYEPVLDGVCGFAWVKIRPATSRFARWLKRTDKGSSAYGGGLMVWISDHRQSLTLKAAHARAMADVLRAAGINAYAESRMD